MITLQAPCKWLLLIILLLQGLTPKAQLAAKFAATPTTGCAPLLVNFSDSSTGNPTGWKWDLGNGTISFLQNPAVTYFTPGQYNIKLIVTSSAGTDSILKNQYVTVYGLPNVDFSGNPNTGCFPLPVQFTDLSTAGSGTIVTREWDFGDGNISSALNPQHTYTAAGNFNVSLRITNSFGCVKTITKTQYIKIGSGVKAGFTNNIPNSCNPPVTINFLNTSTGTGVLNYQWDFGDGITSILTNPTHTYISNGSYTVRLIVTNSNGCTDTLTKVNAITLGNVNAVFTVPTPLCQGAATTFINASSPAPASAFWDFGDGTTSTANDPLKTYNSTGTFVVKMIANFGACIDSVSKTITVLAKPVVAFSANDTTGCKTPFTIIFTSAATGASNYFWDFGDGATSALQNPSHNYMAQGVYTVKLVATNAAGCKDSLVKSSYIVIQPPVVSIPGLPAKGCAPFTFDFTSSVDSIDPVVNYQWNFGDGTTSSLVNPVHTFSLPGNYNISLIITTASGCTDTVVVTNGIIVSTKPVANFSANPRDVCAFIPVDFIDLTTGGADQWLWFFGDGATSTSKNPSHFYEDTGYFDVTLIVWNNGCADTIKFINYIHIKPPIANFNVSADCALPRQRIFTDISIGADTWQWNFGDGTTSNIPGPTHTYALAGTFTVTLTVTNVATGCSHTRSQIVTVISEKADFDVSDNAICKGETINFKAKNINGANIAVYNWNFGDGNGITSTIDLVSHLYTTTGTYTVSLTITDITGCKDSLIKNLFVTVGGPTAVFTANNTGLCLSNSINFNDSSYGTSAIQKWIWNYGDGIIDTLTSPPFSHTYANAGNYSVSLKVIDANGCTDSIVKNSYLIISKPVADFNTADTLSCSTKGIVFNNLSAGPNLTYLWNFGDGTTSTAINPVHTYAAQGTYTVTLNITDQYGCTAGIIKNNYVTIADPKALFTVSDSVSTCPPLIVTFTNNSINAINYSWDFGDGTSSTLASPTHFYTDPGVYNIVLTVTGYNGCTDVRTKQVVVTGPKGSFTYTNINGCNPLQTNFVATTGANTSFIWDFSDGSTISTKDSVISHIYTNPGTYLPKLILVDINGCQVPIVGIDSIRVFGVKANFITTTKTLCDSGFVTFNNTSSSNDIITNYLWNFGDGNTSAQQDPVHGYNTTGIYNVQLIAVTQAGCRDTIQKTAALKIVASPQIAISSPPGACLPATINFNGQLLNADTSAISWSWNFSNGNTSSLQNPLPQMYSTAGAYNVQLVAVNSSGCSDTAVKTVQAYPLPNVVTNTDAWICKGNSITLTATGAASYTWAPATSLSCINCDSTIATPDSTAQYFVQGTSVDGCVASDSVIISVQQSFKITAGNADSICIGKSTTLFVSGADNFAWSPAISVNNTSSPNPIVTPTTTTNYRVIGSDIRGCFSDTAFVPVTVFAMPTVNAGADKTINVGQTIDLDPILSNDVTASVWTPTSGIFRNRFPGVTVKPAQTTEFLVEVSNAGGCKARDRVTVYVLCNNANVFIPNTFSPNGDGANDIFYPRGSGLFTIKSFRIFNRWGEVVYEKANFNANDAAAGWDGTHKGRKLNADVFVYTIDILCENNTVLTYKGNIALIQ